MLDSRLKTFITVSKTENITKAANLLNLSQPAVSQQIKFLEDCYKVKLIKIEGRQFKLTNEGKMFLQYCKEMESISLRIETNLKDRFAVNKSYSIGATMTIGAYILPYLLGEHKKLNPRTDIMLYVNNNAAVLQKVLNHEVHLGIVEGLFDQTKFKYRKLKDDELILAVSPQHGFAHMKNVLIDELLKGNLILRENGSGTRDIFEKAVINKGYKPSDIKPYMEIGNINAIISLVQSNLGYTIISQEAVKESIKNGTIKKISMRDLKIVRSFNFIYMADGALDFVNEFMDFCCKNYK